MDKEQIILVVDDSITNLKLLGSVLNSQYRLAFAKSGVEALSLLERLYPDLILLDIMMPEIDGYETCLRIKENPDLRDIPVIFLTAKNEDSEVLKGFECGGVDYIIKPFKKQELLARIKIQLELKSAREELEKMTDYLRESNSMKDKIISVIAHDIRTPLVNVKMAIEYFLSRRDEQTDKVYDEIVNLLNSSTNDALSLLDNLLNWAKSQSGHININPELHPISDLMNEVTSLFNVNIHNKHINLDIEIEPSLNVFADKDMLKVVLRNLISNAIKFTPEKGTLFLKAQNFDDLTEIIIADSGVGMTEEQQKKLFSETEHFSTWGTNNEKGSGIGLLLCRDFIKKNNGFIQVKSESGKGSSFSIILPSLNPEEVG